MAEGIEGFEDLLPRKAVAPQNPAPQNLDIGGFEDLMGTPARAAPNQEDLGFFDALGRGLKAGSVGLAESVGTGLRWTGGRAGAEGMADVGKRLEQHFAEIGEQYAPPEEIRGSIIDNPRLLTDSSWWGYNIGNVLPSFAASIIPGVGAAKLINVGGKALAWTPQLVTKLARIGGATAGGVAGGSLEGAATYREVIRRGGTEADAAKAAELMTLASAGLNALSVGKLLGQSGSRVGHALKAGATESVTEWLEEPAEAAILGDDVLQAMKEGINVMPIAFVTGGLAGGVMAPNTAPKTTPQPEAPPVPEGEPVEAAVSLSLDEEPEAPQAARKPVGTPPRGPYADMSTNDIGIEALGEVSEWEGWGYKVLTPFEINRIEKMPEPEREATFRDAARVLRDKGYYVEAVPDDVRVSRWDGENWGPGVDALRNDAEATRAIERIEATFIRNKTGYRNMPIEKFNALYKEEWGAGPADTLPEEVTPEESRENASATFQPGPQYKGLLAGTQLADPAEIAEDPIRRENILKPFAKALGVPLYYKRVKGKTTLGFYRRGIEEVRTKAKNDLEVAAHEIAHMLDDRDPEIKKAYRSKQFKKEVLGVSYDVKKANEGFAEFMRLYMTQNNEAKARVPNFYQWFEKHIAGTPLAPIIEKAKTEMHDWYAQGPLNRFKSKAARRETWAQRMRRRVTETVDRWFDKSLQRTFDRFHSIKLIEQYLNGGKLGSAEASPYKTFRETDGSRMMTRAVYEHGTIGWNDKGEVVFTGKGLRQIFEPVADVLDDALYYFAARRAAELKKQGRENLFASDEIAAALALGEKNPKIKEAFSEYQAFNKRMLDFAQTSGLISAESRKVLEVLGRDYVPFYRVMDEIQGGDASGKPKNEGPFHRLHGSTLNVADILDNIALNAATIIRSAVINRAKLSLYKMVSDPKRRGGAHFAARIPPDTHAVQVQKEQVLARMRKAGVEIEEEQADALSDLLTFFTFGHAPTGNNIDSVMSNGKRIYFEIADPLLLESIQSFGIKNYGLAVRLLSGFSSTLRRLVTLDPGFMLVNLLRDTGSAFLLTKAGFRPGIDTARGFKSAMTKDPEYWEFVVNGGGFASLAHAEAGSMRRRLERFYVKNGIDYRTVLDTPHKLLDWVDDFGSGFEYASRLGEFKRMKEKGANLREAAFAAREVSTDFAMRGTSEFLRMFTMTVPFLNARMQGLYRIGRGFKGDVKGVNWAGAGALSLKAVTGIMLPTLALYALNKDDERYKALPPWVRDLHWVILPPGTDEVYLIPKPFELGAVFASFPERYAEYLRTHDGEALVDAWLTIIHDQLNMNPIPQAVKPLYEQAVNRNFLGGPIVPDDLKDVESFEQYRPYTSETMRALGKKLDMSPMRLEAVFRGYFGTLGSYALAASDAIARDEDKIGKASSTRLDEIWVLKRLVRQTPLKHTSYETEFYDMSEEANKIVNTVRKMRQEGRGQDIQEFLSDRERMVLFAQEKMLKDVRRQAAMINRQIRLIEEDATTTPEIKRQRIDELMAQRNNVFEQVVTQLQANQQEQTPIE